MTRAISIGLVALVLGACVTERTPSRTSGAAGGSGVAGRAPTPRPPANRDPVPMPTGPIARPALEARTVNARTLVSIQPIGAVPYDGMVLPIVSPDGTRLATQTGDPPGWPTLLAALGAPPSMRTRIEVYDITTSPPRIIRPREQLPAGLLLGRASDATGFLVESPQPNGTRRIGRVSWADARIQWLTDADAVHAFAAFDAHGRVLSSRRAPDEAQFRVAIGGVPMDLTPGASALMPIYDTAAGLYAIFVEGPMGLEVQLRSPSAHAGGATSDGLQLIARRTLADDGGAPTAYQAAEPMRGAIAVGPQAGASPGVLLFHPGARRMVVIDPTTADLIPLASGSIAGCWAPDALGWAVMVTTPDGLQHQRIERDASTGLWRALPAARMLGQTWVPRATMDPAHPFILIGPDKRRPTRVMLASLRLADESESTIGGR